MRVSMSRILSVMMVLGFASLASADLPEGLSFDEGYTWYELENHDESRDGRSVDAGWSLTARLRVFGEADRDSAFRLVIKQGRRTLAELRCEGDRHLPDNEGDANYFVQRNCRDREMRVTQTGEVQVEVHFIDGDSEEDHLAAMHTLRIRTATRTRSDGQVMPSHHYIDRSNEIANSLIRMAPRRVDGYAGGDRYSHNFVEVIINVTRGESLGNRTRGQLRCTVDGERVRADERRADGRLLSRRNVRLDNMTRGEHNYFGFSQLRIELPISYGEEAARNESYLALEDHPGAWECRWTVEGETLRTFSFTVADGAIVAHPEEATGLSLPWGAHLLEVTIPGATAVDTRTQPTSSGFYGREWSSDEARANAAAIPSAGANLPDARGRRGRRSRRRR